MTRRLTVVLTLVLALLVACTNRSPEPSPNAPPPHQPSADAVAKQVAAALTKGDLTGLPVAGPGLDAAKKDYATVMGGMDGLLPQVSAGTVTYPSAGKAVVPLTHTWTLGPKTWKYPSTAALTLVDGAWQVAWASTIVNPDLTPTTRLRHDRTLPARASITGAKGEALVEQGDVQKLGIDKMGLAKSEWEKSARQLAAILKIDADAYAKAVLAAGDQAFVVAIVMRPSEVPAEVTTVKGYASVKTTAMLSVNPTFARSVIGVMGVASPEQVKASKGGLLAGDMVGVSGLQRRYDTQLGGVPGQSVYQVARKTAGASPSASSPAFVDVTLFTFEPVAGKPVATSLDIDMQLKAEQVLTKANGVAAMVVVDQKTGEVLVAANSPASGANPDATFGRYAPGSTFKVVTSLALLRAGYTPQSMVPCTATVTVNGKTFKNYADFPASKVGTITLTDALANSCNTAFISQAAKLGPQALADAAASLGFGTDYDSGYTSFYGSVPATTDPVMKAADTIGQGQVEASPLAMAGVAASVAAGRTVVPALVTATKPVSKAKPLTAAEASALQTMMRAVVTDGSGRVLAGQMDGAKTGTAEFGTANPPKTHAWMIAWNGEIAIAVLVNEGESGSKTAAPLIKAFLT